MRESRKGNILWLSESPDVADAVADAAMDASDRAGYGCEFHTSGMSALLRSGLPDRFKSGEPLVVAFNEQSGLPSAVAAVVDAPVLALPVVFRDDTTSAAARLEACLAADPDAPVVALPPNQPAAGVRWISRWCEARAAAATAPPPEREEAHAEGQPSLGADVIQLGYRSGGKSLAPHEEEGDHEDFDAEDLRMLAEYEELILEAPAKIVEEPESALRKHRPSRRQDALDRQLREIEELRGDREVQRALSEGTRSEPGAGHRGEPLVLRVDPSDPAPEAVERLHDTLLEGGIAGVPGDTYFKILCDAANPAAVDRLRALAGKTAGPLQVLVGDERMLGMIVRLIPDDCRPLMRRFWPGPLTLVFRKPAAALESVVPGEQIGIRMPRSRLLAEVLRMLARPLAFAHAVAPSGQPLLSHERVIETMGETLDLVVRGTLPAPRQPPTVVDVSGEPFRLMRRGAVGHKDLADALPDSMLRDEST